MRKRPESPGTTLARMRWSKPDADRDQPRQAGKLGGRPKSPESDWYVEVDGQRSVYVPRARTEAEARRQLLKRMRDAGAPYTRLPSGTTLTRVPRDAA